MNYSRMRFIALLQAVRVEGECVHALNARNVREVF